MEDENHEGNEAMPAVNQPSVIEPSPSPKAEGNALVTLIDRWWDDHFPGSPVGRDTEIWNHTYAAKEDLKRRIAAL